MAEETKSKVLEAVDKLGYSPDATGRMFRTGKRKMIGLIVPDITNSVFAALIEDVDDVISKEKYNLVISNTRDKLELEKKALRTLSSGIEMCIRDRVRHWEQLESGTIIWLQVMKQCCSKIMMSF